MLSLLGFTHIVSGTILYDGVDITTISKKRLRQAIAMVPQDPLLFQGTISSNLDPGNCIDVAQLQRTLNKCSSIETMQKSDKSVSFKGRLMLDTAVSAGGSNFSHGQRQVLSLCRALSRETHLMLLDEATSSVDSDTDAAIQSVLRDEVCSASESQRGLITIAHRLQTILDYDKIVVMGFGKVLEAGSPKDLLAMNGMFHDMVKHSK
jgi:ABC-type multidrug transport system fused ATPase/permease subunit